MKSDIGIIGGGAWGTALAQVQASSGRNVFLWAREAAVVNAINNEGENIPFLPGVALHRNVMATLDLQEAATPETILLVTPAQHTRSVLQQIGTDKLAGKTLVLCAKGIEIETGELLSDIVREITPQSTIAVLTGPTFAREIAMGLPSAVTVAAPSLETARKLAQQLGSKNFRPYASDDVIGAEVGGAVKNVLAIACGIVAGKQYGDSARAALLTRGMSEMMRLAIALGGRKETLMGMCGMGDLVLTANSMQSRNFSLGYLVGEGKTPADVLSSRTAVTEGVHTAKAVKNLMKRLSVELPVMSAVFAILHEGKNVDTTIDALLSRPFGDEA
ncbi:MAG: NAD(P)-dependent glycerol-3-phosphate dehydrogenase [Alphaproteobacteria bacterium]|nr:NAD(P)-dependent glycerol-3-phosphate dehydrogenase [Alphaproteobacteria bacterium]